MTRVAYQSMFVFLSALLLAVLFAVQPTDNKEVRAFQAEIQTKFAQAGVEVIGDESFTEPFAFIWSGVSEFYEVAAAETIALVEPSEEFLRMAMMFNKEYERNVAAARAPLALHATLPTEDPIYNIVPMNEAEELLDPNFSEDLAYPETNGRVAGESIDRNDVSSALPPVVWQTINDSITGLPYCVAIFNETVNSYPGPCATDDNYEVFQH